MQTFMSFSCYFMLTLVSCYTSPDSILFSHMPGTNPPIINKEGKDVHDRFKPPAGFERKQVDTNSFAFYLRHLPLKAIDSHVKLYNGEIKRKAVHEAVVDMPLGDKNLQQCADAIMRLRAEYFFSIKQYDNIVFTLTNGFKVEYTKWMEGHRVVVDQNKTYWRKSAQPSNSYRNFEKYLELVFTYAGTLSLAKSLTSKSFNLIAIGDVFIVGGSPGHAVIVVDVAENKEGEKVFMLAQSYMPAQDTHILKNVNDKATSPWYRNNSREELHTPEWTFNTNQLKSW